MGCPRARSAVWLHSRQSCTPLNQDPLDAAYVVWNLKYESFLTVGVYDSINKLSLTSAVTWSGASSTPPLGKAGQRGAVGLFSVALCSLRVGTNTYSRQHTCTRDTQNVLHTEQCIEFGATNCIIGIEGSDVLVCTPHPGPSLEEGQEALCHQ